MPAPLVYIDANVFIYAVEGDEAVARPGAELLETLRQHPLAGVTSELTLAEVLPKALPDHRRMYFNLIVWSGLFALHPVTRDILIETAAYRRAAASGALDHRTGMPKLPDSIHVVTALRAGCRWFVSNEPKMKLPESMSAILPNRGGIDRLLKEFP